MKMMAERMLEVNGDATMLIRKLFKKKKQKFGNEQEDKINLRRALCKSRHTPSPI